jgi:hypothetical protein
MDNNKMPQDTLSFIQKIQEYGLIGYFWIIIISLWAGTVRYLTNLNGSKPTFLGWLTDAMVSGFVGVIAGLTCQHFQVEPSLSYALSGICAHNGTRSLNLITQIIKKNSDPTSIR